MNQKYNLVDTVDKLKALDRILMDGQTPRYQVLAYDTETNGLDLYKSTVVGFSVSFNRYSGYYIPILKWVPDESSRKVRSVDKVQYSACMKGRLRCVWTGEFFDEFVTPEVYNMKERFPLIPALIARWFENTNLIMHNAPFDVNMTYINSGIDLKNQVFVDTSLLLHILDENNSHALKKAAERYKIELGINPHAQAALEKQELDVSIIKNGGRPGMVWRADLGFQSKYACADTFLTFGMFQVAMKEFKEKFGERGMKWFFEQEVMPVCKEVVIDMKRRGVYIDVPYFKKLHTENAAKLELLEDEVIKTITPHLTNFTLGKSLERAVSTKRLLNKIIELEGLSVPKVIDKKTGNSKESLAKAAVKKEFEKNPHWVWGYILGEDELKYSEQKLESIKRQLYVEAEERRHRFNINSRDHLTWLFCEKLGMNKESLPQTDSATKENPIPSMDADVLRDHMLPKFPWVSTLMTYKKLQKLQSTYINPALELNINGWLYMDMKQNGTTSGRFSCSGGYNLQTLPRVDDEMEILNECDKCGAERLDKSGKETGKIKIIQEIECIADRSCTECGYILKDIPRPSSIKKGFIAPPGYKIINADYSSLEPRCFAFVSGEEELKKVYRDGLDLYSKVYCDVFDEEKQYSADPNSSNFLKKVAKAKRNWIKPVVLAIPYGAEDYQVASLLGAKTEKKNWKGEIVRTPSGEPEMVPDRAEGKRVREQYLKTYPQLHKYMLEQDEKATLLGYVETLVGRRRHLPFSKKINDVLTAHGIDWRDLMSAPIWELEKGPNVSCVSDRGQRISLTAEMLEELRELIKFKKESVIEKGYWAYIRAMLRGDLNNSKNQPIQGVAGHLANKGMLDSNRRFRANNLDAWIALQIHDELMGYVKMSQSEIAAQFLKESMEKNEFTALLDVDMIAEPVICDNLKEAK